MSFAVLCCAVLWCVSRPRFVCLASYCEIDLRGLVLFVPTRSDLSEAEIGGSSHLSDSEMDADTDLAEAEIGVDNDLSEAEIDVASDLSEARSMC